jgi:hypothetical protein
MTKILHIKVQVKKTKKDVMFNTGSQDNLIKAYLVCKLRLEVQNHPNPYPLGWVDKDAEIKVTK